MGEKDWRYAGSSLPLVSRPCTAAAAKRLLKRTVRELQGLACKQEITCTCSLGCQVTRWESLDKAVTEFTGRTAHKLHGQSSLADQMLVLVRTRPFCSEAQFDRSVGLPLRWPSTDTGVIVLAALRGLRVLYQPGHQLAKAGGMLSEFQPDAVLQSGLDLQAGDAPDRRQLMTMLDRLNQRYGRSTVKLASGGLG